MTRFVKLYCKVLGCLLVITAAVVVAFYSVDFVFEWGIWIAKRSPWLLLPYVALWITLFATMCRYLAQKGWVDLCDGDD